MSIELRHLRYFVAVAEELNITKAAARLHTVQPSLGRQIYQLEEFVGVPLLLREGHRLALTEAGRIMLGESRRILHELELIIEQLQREANMTAGRITVGFFPGGELRVFPQLLPYLRSNYPDIELVLRSLKASEQLAALRNRTMDAGFLRGPIEDEPQITYETVFTDEIMAFLPAKHPLAKEHHISLRKFAQVPMVELSSLEAPAFNQFVVSLGEEVGIKFRCVLKTESTFATLSAVGAGIGCCLLPSYLEQLMPSTIVARRLNRTPPTTIDLLLVYRKDDTRHNLMVFLSAVRNCFRNEQQDESKRGPVPRVRPKKQS
jgi:LysR family hca operon transcriptional activator